MSTGPFQSDEYLSWTLEYLSARVKTDDPFEAIQLLYPIVYIIGKETRVVSRTTFRRYFYNNGFRSLLGL